MNDKPRINSLVKFDDDYIKLLSDSGYDIENKDDMFVYMGEIPNMSGHCVVMDITISKLIISHHTDSFRELRDEEI